MSVRVMAWVFEHGPADPSERLVLLALADYAADNGEWAPSMIGIAGKAGMTERGARGVIRRLEAGGWIAVQVGGGRGGKSRYRVLMDRQNPEPKTRIEKPGITNPECGAPIRAENPERDDTKPGTRLHETRNGGSAVPSGTIIEPPEGKERATRAPDQAAEVRRVLIDAGATPAAVTSFLSHYRAKVRKPLSLVGAERLAGTLRTIIDSGGDADDALGLAEERGWQSVKADWYFREKANDTGGKAGFGPNGRRQDRTDPTLERIARLAGIVPPPGHDRH